MGKPVRVMLTSVFSSRPNLPKVMAFTGDLSLVTETRCCSLYTRRSPAERTLLQTYPEGGARGRKGVRGKWFSRGWGTLEGKGCEGEGEWV